MDACSAYLHELDILMESYEEPPAYESIFEVADEEVAKATSKMAETQSKAKNLLDKAIKSVKKIIQTAIDFIKNIFEFFKADKGERDEYRAFVKECRENPEFRKMKVTLHDYREINTAYEKELSAMENEYKRLKDEEVENRPSLAKDIKEGVEKVGRRTADILKGAGSAVTIEVALKYAAQSKEAATAVKFMLDYDLGLINKLETELGKKEVKKFQRKVKILNSRISCLHWLAMGRKDQSKTLAECIKEVMDKCRGKEGRKAQVKESLKLKRRMKDNQGLKETEEILDRNGKKLVKGATKIGVSAVKEHNQDARKLRRLQKRYDKKYGKSESNFNDADILDLINK